MLCARIQVLTAEGQTVTYRLGHHRNGAEGDARVVEELSLDVLPAACQHVHADRSGWTAR